MKLLNESMVLWERSMENIRQFIGLNKVVQAATPQERQGKGVSQMAVNATSNTLSPIYDGFLWLQTTTSTDCVDRISELVKVNKKTYEAYYPAIGKTGMELLKITPKDVDRKYGLLFKVKLQDEQKEVIRQAAVTAMQPGIKR